MLASGRGSNLDALLRAQKAGTLGARIVAVGGDNPEAPALALARRNGIPTRAFSFGEEPEADTEARIATFLRGQGAEMLVLAGYMRVLHASLLGGFPAGIINIHPSLLPSFPGLFPQAQALEAGVKIAGCTVHFVDAGVDTGPIIAQAAVPVREGDTVETLSCRILRQEHRLLPRVVRQLAQGRIEREGSRVRIRGEEST